MAGIRVSPGAAIKPTVPVSPEVLKTFPSLGQLPTVRLGLRRIEMDRNALGFLIAPSRRQGEVGVVMTKDGLQWVTERFWRFHPIGKIFGREARPVEARHLEQANIGLDDITVGMGKLIDAVNSMQSPGNHDLSRLILRHRRLDPHQRPFLPR